MLFPRGETHQRLACPVRNSHRGLRRLPPRSLHVATLSPFPSTPPLLCPAASTAAVSSPHRPKKRTFQTIIHLAASTGAPSRPAYWHRGIGYDYAFADVVGENVVSKETRMWTYLFVRKAGSGWTLDHNRRRSRNGNCNNGH